MYQSMINLDNTEDSSLENKVKLNHIELFAGCGGLSLGLESEGYSLVFANELSPMAGETFAYNLLAHGEGEDLKLLGEEGGKARHTFWLNSHFKENEIAKRLRENPRQAPKLGEGFNDLNERFDQLDGGLVIGDIISLNEYLSSPENANNLEKIRSAFGKSTRGVDLVSGGPPCQSFSMAGLRQHDNERNRLPWEFARFVDLVQPRSVVLENVSGILHAFNIKGEKYYAWFEVAKAFASKGYVPICLHVNAKYVGAAQNRPRFIMIAFRKDVFDQFQAISSRDGTQASIDILEISSNFYDRAKNNPNLKIHESGYFYHDVEKHSETFKGSFLNAFLVRNKSNFHTVLDAIGDLKITAPSEPSSYVSEINSLLDRPATAQPLNHEMRSNSLHVKKRFSLYQALSKVPAQTKKKVALFLRTDDPSAIDETVLSELSKHKYLLNDVNGNELISYENHDQLVTFLRSLHTKKQTQRALKQDEPAPAALSIPDDACHYEELRTLSVREMARVQSFPDWFELRSKVTTGGQMRRFEVPQYTQVGNAVPPLLGAAIGKTVKKVLSTVDRENLATSPRKKKRTAKPELPKSLEVF